MKTIIKRAGVFLAGIINAGLMAVFILALLPIPYFAWRMSQPMSLPAYEGRSYFEVLAWRQETYGALAQDYQRTHPGRDVKEGMCFQSELAMIAYNLPFAGFCALSEVVPELAGVVGPGAKALGCGNSGGNWFTFLPTWWQMYERFTYELHTHAVDGPVRYCRAALP